MKKLLMAVVMAAAAVLALGLGAGTAHAEEWHPTGDKGDHDSTLYWAEMVRQGLSGNPDEAAGMGQRFCANLKNGDTEDDLVRGSMMLSGATRAQAKVALWGAEWHSCPDYY